MSRRYCKFQQKYGHRVFPRTILAFRGVGRWRRRRGWSGLRRRRACGIALGDSDAVFEAPALVAGLYDIGVMREPVEQRGWTTISDRLVLVLHAGFFFAALGFLFAGAHALWPDVASQAASEHIWAIGGIGTMTLAMMTRATLGHTGHDLVASRATQLVYLAVVVAMLARVTMEFMPVLMLPLLYGAATAWILAFGGFAFVYGPMLARRAGHRGS